MNVGPSLGLKWKGDRNSTDQILQRLKRKMVAPLTHKIKGNRGWGNPKLREV